MPGITDDELDLSIRDILKGADLSSLSSKKVREKLEEKFGVDLADRKQQVDNILMRIVNEEGASDDENGAAAVESDDARSSDPYKNNHATASTFKRKPDKCHSSGVTSSSSDSDSEVVDREPIRKKSKIGQGSRGSKAANRTRNGSNSVEVDDDALTKRLHQEELGLRPRKLPEKKVTKRSSKPRPARVCVLSEELSAIVGADRLSRKDVVKRMWEVIRERSLTDPKQKQFIICDAQFERLFKKKRIKAFGMMKTLKNHCKEAHLVSK